MSLSLESLDDH